MSLTVRTYTGRNNTNIKSIWMPIFNFQSLEISQTFIKVVLLKLPFETVLSIYMSNNFYILFVYVLLVSADNNN